MRMKEIEAFPGCHPGMQGQIRDAISDDQQHRRTMNEGHRIMRDACVNKQVGPRGGRVDAPPVTIDGNEGHMPPTPDNGQSWVRIGPPKK